MLRLNLKAWGLLLGLQVLSCSALFAAEQTNPANQNSKPQQSSQSNNGKSREEIAFDDDESLFNKNQYRTNADYRENWRYDRDAYLSGASPVREIDSQSPEYRNSSQNYYRNNYPAPQTYYNSYPGYNPNGYYNSPNGYNYQSSNYPQTYYSNPRVNTYYSSQTGSPQYYYNNPTSYSQNPNLGAGVYYSPGYNPGVGGGAYFSPNSSVGAEANFGPGTFVR